MVSRRLHDAFRPQPGGAKVAHNTLLDLTDAAARYGIHVLDADLETQAMLVAGMQIRSAISAMLEYDRAKLREEKLKTERARRPKPKRRR